MEAKWFCIFLICAVLAAPIGMSIESFSRSYCVGHSINVDVAKQCDNDKH